jgi:hypothetical protein
MNKQDKQKMSEVMTMLSKKGVKARLGGLTKEQKSKYMSDVRKGKTPKVDNQVDNIV